MQNRITNAERAAALGASVAKGLKGLNSRTVAVGAGVALAAVAVFWISGGFGTSSGAVAQSQRRGGGDTRGVPVEIAQAVKKKIPVRAESLGTVTPVANVAIKTR